MKYAIVFLLMFVLGAAYAQKKVLSIAESTVEWQARYVVTGGHQGEVPLVSGYLIFGVDGGITKGEVVLDLVGIKATDISVDNGRNDLEEHLRSADFLSTDMYPKGFFAINRSAMDSSKPNTYLIDGFLALRNATNRIQFPATIVREGDLIKAEATTTIDRTKWNINHQSGSLFGNLKDGAISDEVVVTMKLVFR